MAVPHEPAPPITPEIDVFAAFTATTLTAQADAGQPTLVVESIEGFSAGDRVWIGVPSATLESGEVLSVAGLTITLTENLSNTFAAGQPVSLSPAEVVNARGTAATLDARLGTLALASDLATAEADIAKLETFINAADYGAIGDDTADDTAALQAAFDALVSSSNPGLIIPRGTFKITSPLTIPAAVNTRAIIGAGRDHTTIRQHTPNVAVVKTGGELIHSMVLSEMTLDYASPQPAANTGAIALNFTSPTSGISFGWFYWHVQRLTIRSAQTAIGVSGTGMLPIWNCDFHQVRTQDISQTLVNFNSPTVAGQPINSFRNWTHLGSTVAPAGPAFILVACEAYFDSLDIEDWTGRLFYVFGGSPVVVNGLHVERHHLADTSPMFEVANQPLSITGANISFDVTSGAAARLVVIGAGGSFAMRESTVSVTSLSGTLTAMTSGGRPYDLRNVHVGGVAGAVAFTPQMPIATSAVGDAGATAACVGNRMYFTLIETEATASVSSMRFEVITSGGGYSAALYDGTGARLAQIPYQGTPAAGVATKSLGATVTLQPGQRYYVGILSDNGAQVFAHRTSAPAGGAQARSAGLAGHQDLPNPNPPATITLPFAAGGDRQYSVELI
jgi:hypothetical protein